MRELLRRYLDGGLSRRRFLRRLVATGFTASAARSVAEAADQDAPAEGGAERYTPLSGTGGDLLAEQIRAAGTKYVFTNPGSFEVGFFDALTDRPELQVVVGLHEGIVVSMADGYQRVTQQPAFVNVHAIAGTAQMAGQLYNAHRDGSALVVTAGLLDGSNYSDDVRLSPRPGFHQSDVNRQFTKISWEVRNAASIPVVTRRAFKTAAAAPGGPVYVAYSSGSLEAREVKGEIWPAETFLIRARPRPDRDLVARLAKELVEARRPIVIVGDEVWKSGAQAEAVRLCELLGLPAAVSVHAGSRAGISTQAFCNFPTEHPQYVDDFASARPYGDAAPDLVAQFGAGDLGGVVVPDRPLLDPGARVAAVSLDANRIGRTQPVDLAILADVRETFRDLIDAVTSALTAGRLQEIREARLAAVMPYAASLRKSVKEAARKNFERSPIHPDRLGHEIDQAADPDAILVSENLTSTHGLYRLGHRPDEKTWLATTGSSLGWGIGAAIGAKLGAPDRQVILSIGDGSVMYSAAGFWSMARYAVPVLVVVWNNHNYQSVRNAFTRYAGRMAQTGRFHGMYLGDPEIDFVKLAESQGVRGERVTEPAAIAAALKRGAQAARDGRPYLVEVVVARVGPGADSTWHQKFSLAEQRKRMV